MLTLFNKSCNLLQLLMIKDFKKAKYYMQYKKFLLLATCTLGLNLFESGIADAGTADGHCSVLGIQEPGTNIYDGPTFCAATSLSYITVRGPLEITNSAINGKTDVSGSIKAISAKLHDVTLENNHTLETVSLQTNSTIDGNITFLGHEGIVYLENGSSIKGKVINGKVVDQVNKNSR
jgi:hypothetical protein